MVRRLVGASVAIALSLFVATARGEAPAIDAFTGSGATRLTLRMVPVSGRFGKHTPTAALYDATLGARLCALPCELMVDRSRSFVIAGPDTASDPFTIPMNGSFTVTATSALGTKWPGALMMGLGGVLMASSLLLLAVDRDHPTSAEYGLAIGAGLTLAGGGVWLFSAPASAQPWLADARRAL